MKKRITLILALVLVVSLTGVSEKTIKEEEK